MSVAVPFIPSEQGYTMKLSSLKADLAREEEGDWVEIPDFPGVSLKVRSANSKAYSMQLSVLSQKFARKYGQRPIPPEDSLRGSGKLLARYILLDWKGLDDDVAQPLIYSADLAEELLTNPEYRKLANAVLWAAQRIAEAEVDELDDVIKNSEKPSAMTSSGEARTTSSST
jgi:hypothetical protein